MATPFHHTGPAPYAPPAAVTAVIERSRNGSLPSPVDSGLLQRIGVQESLAPRTLASLKLLDLITDDGQPTETLEALRVAKSSEFGTALGQWLQSLYGEVFGLVGDIGSASYSNVEDAFRGYKPDGQRRRMITLFLGLCEYAGLLPDASELRGSNRSAQRDRSSAPKTKSKPKARAASSKPAADTNRGPQAPPAPQPLMSKADLLPSAQRDLGISPFVTALIGSLPAAGSVWPDSKRKDWLAAAEASFNLMYERPEEQSS